MVPSAVQFWAHMLDESFPENDDGVLRKCVDKLSAELRLDGCSVLPGTRVRDGIARLRYLIDGEAYTVTLSIGEETLNGGLPDQEEH